MAYQFIRQEPCYDHILFVLALDRDKMKERILIGTEQQIRFRLDGNKDNDVIYDITRPLGRFLLAQHLEIDLKDIMAIGDHQNDIEMLTEAGIGVAVGNATDEAKNSADFVAEGRCIDGVAEAVEKYCDIVI